MPHPILELATLFANYGSGRTPEEVIDAVFDRLAAVDDPGIFITMVDRSEAKQAAAALGAFDPARPLWGVPFAVKDNIDVAGLPTTAACPAFSYQPTMSAPAVERLLAAGAILIGKTNLDQFATGLVGLRTPYPAPRNAYDPNIVPGGSSSGSAVAVAQGIVAFALGTDTAGSGRIPAALNNLVGLKPSLGAVSSRGVVPACRSLDTISIFANDVDDAWRVYETIAGYDALDPFSRPLKLGSPGVLPPHTRLGIPRREDLEFFGDTDAEIAWHAAVDLCRGLSMELVEIDMRSFLATARLLYEGPWIAERFAALRHFMASHGDTMLPVTRSIIESAERFSATDTFDGFYQLVALRREVEHALAACDALCVPSLPRIPTIEEVTADPFAHNTRLGRWTNFVNLLDLAALAVPGPRRHDQRPAGVTFIGQRGSDAQLAGLGRALHAASSGRPPSVVEATVTDGLPEGWTELAVIGAHKSGMPLNGELLQEGAVFLRAIRTEARYRLYALPGPPPARPGLHRVDGEGFGIAAEVWALPTKNFGRFIARIPAPLSVGTVLLADGSRPKGFLVEAAATRDAKDISEFLDWRDYVQ